VGFHIPRPSGAGQVSRGWEGSAGLSPASAPLKEKLCKTFVNPLNNYSIAPPNNRLLEVTKMGIKRETYERKFKELFAEIVKLVDDEVDRWRGHKIEVRKEEVSPEKLIYIVEWRGQPLNAFTLEFRRNASGYPSIIIYYDCHSEEVFQLPRKLDKKEAIFLNLYSLLLYFIEDTIHREAKKVALQQGFFAGIKGGDLFVHISDYELRLRYLKDNHGWLVECDDPKLPWTLYECGDYNSLEFLPYLLKALVLRLSL